MTREDIVAESQEWRQRGSRWREAGGVAMAQRCEAVARNLRWAADEMREVAIRGMEPK